MDAGLARLLREIMTLEQRKAAAMEELTALDQQLFLAKSGWVRARQGLCALASGPSLEPIMSCMVTGTDV